MGLTRGVDKIFQLNKFIVPILIYLWPNNFFPIMEGRKLLIIVFDVQKYKCHLEPCQDYTEEESSMCGSLHSDDEE